MKLKNKIHITKTAGNNFKNTILYIKYVLKNSQASNDLIKEFDSKVNSLKDDPNKRPLARDKILANKGIRIMNIKNYLIFYIFDEKSKTIHIINFLHKNQDWISILRKEDIRLGEFEEVNQ